MPTLPGGKLTSRPLHFIWIADCSGSMGTDGKIQTLNVAVKEAIPHMQKAADDNASADLVVRVVTFSSGARWHVSQPTPIADFKWTDLTADGVTDMGQALMLVAEQLKMPPMEPRALPPVLVLLSDGQPTDDVASGLKALLEQPWGKKAVRIAIAVGSDADAEVLGRFVNNPELPVLQANSPEALVKHIRWVSTSVVQSVSAPPSQLTETGAQAVNVPIAVPADLKAYADGDPNEVW